jgi:phosphatidylglycerol lysyltransferase
MQTVTAEPSAIVRSKRMPIRLAAVVGAWAPALLLAVSAAVSLASVFAFLRPVTGRLDGYLPLDPASAQPAAALVSAVGFGALAIGLVRGRSVAWWMAIATLSVSLIGQAHAYSRPIGLLLIGGLLAVLFADRRRYEVETGAGPRRLMIALLVAGGLVIALETSLILAASGRWPTPLAAIGDITAAVGNALGMSDSTARHVLHQTSRGALVALLILASRLPIVLAALGVLSRVPDPPLDPSTRARARAIAQQYGSGALLPFQLGEDKHVFSSPDADGIVVYGIAGRTAVVLGDLIGPPEALPAVFREFLTRCRRTDRWPIVYQASAASRSLLTAAGFRLFKVGEEAIVDLATFELSGSRRANLRHTITRCRKDGVSFRWFETGIRGEESGLVSELEVIDAAWQRNAGPRMGFTISSFDRASLGRQPVSVAVDASGHVLGYATFRATGSDGGYVLDLMRRVSDGPPGVVEACIAEAAVAFRAAGAATLSLGLAPLANLDVRHGLWEERVLAAGARFVRPWYDVSGLAFFKRKFDPCWIPRYGAIRRRRDLVGFAVGLLRVHLSGSFRLPGRPPVRAAGA